MKSLRIVLSLAVLSTLFACPPDPKVVAEKTAKDTSALLREAWQSAEQTNDWQSVDRFFEGTFGLRRGHTENTTAIYVPAVSNFDSNSDTASKSFGRVFDKSNVEKTEGGAVYFRVRGVDLCAGSDGIVNTGCADAIDRMTPMLKVSGDLDIAILLGTSKVEAAVFHLVSKKSIAIDFDLSRAKDVSELMQRAINPNTTPVMTGDATGKVQVKLEKNGDYDFTVSVSFLSDLNVAWHTDSITSRSYFVQARTPAVEVHLAAPAKRITSKIDFGTVRSPGTTVPEAITVANPTASPVSFQVTGLTATGEFTAAAAGTSAGCGGARRCARSCSGRCGPGPVSGSPPHAPSSTGWCCPAGSAGATACTTSSACRPGRSAGPGPRSAPST